MRNWVKAELKHAKQERKRCQKIYSDWRDDEFNCGANKFIFGILSDDNKILSEAPQTGIPSFQTLNALQVYYNRDSKKYLLDIDPYALDMTENSVGYLNSLLEKLKAFVDSKYVNDLHGFIEDDLCRYLDDMSNYWSDEHLNTLYFKFYAFVKGYEQLMLARDLYLNQKLSNVEKEKY